MLDVMRKHSGSFIIYVLFAIIILVFVVNFGPQSAGCTAGTSFAARVAGQAITLNDFSYALAVSGIHNRRFDEAMMPQLRGMVMDQLIVRELLAQDAKRLGLRIGDQEVDDMILQGRFLALGQPQPLIRDDNGNFDYDLFSRYVRYAWGTTVKGFKEHQRRELLAERLLTVMRAAVKASAEEVRADYIQRHTQAQLEYIRFSPEDFYADIALTADDLAQFVQEQKARIQQYYEENLVAYSQLPLQFKVQVIVLDNTDQAQTLADSLHQRLRAGEDFGALATKHSAHWSNRQRGRVGWRNVNAAGLDNAVDEALRTQPPSEPTLVTGTDGLWLVQVLDRREGDISLAQAAPDIAEELLRLDRALVLAQAKAEDALAEVGPAQTLSDVFPSGDGALLPTERPAAGEIRVFTTTPFSRDVDDHVPGLGPSPELMDAALTLAAGEVVRRPFVVANRVYLVGVKEQTTPDMARWETDQASITAEYLDRLWQARAHAYIRDRCVQSVQEKRIDVMVRMSQAPMAPPLEGGTPSPAAQDHYQPCASLGML